MAGSIETWAEAVFDAVAKKLGRFVHEGQTFVLSLSKDESLGTFLATMNVADGTQRFVYRVDQGVAARARPE